MLRAYLHTCHDCLVHIGNEEKADSHGQGNFVDRVFEKLCEFHILEPLNTLMKSTKVPNLRCRQCSLYYGYIMC